MYNWLSSWIISEDKDETLTEKLENNEVILKINSKSAAMSLLTDDILKLVKLNLKKTDINSFRSEREKTPLMEELNKVFNKDICIFFEKRRMSIEGKNSCPEWTDDSEDDLNLEPIEDL